RMRLPLAPGVTGSYSTAREWKLTESALTAKLSTVPAAGGGSSVSLSMYIHAVTSGTRLRWYYSAVNNQLRALSEVGGSDASPTTLTYSPIDHAWLRIREAGGTLYFESSPDGWDWAVQRSLPTPAWVTSDTVQVEFAAFRNTGTTDYAEWDLIGARVRPRFYGMVNEFPVSWSGMTSSVSISATDLFKRLNRLPALRSMLGMEVLTVDTLTGRYSFPAVYFPLAEPSGSAAAGDVVGHGSSALAVTQVGSGGSVTFGDEGVPETGETAPAFAPASATAGQYLVGDLGPQTAADSTTSLEHIQVWVKTSTAGRAIVGLHDLALDNQLILSLNGSGVLQVESTQDGSALTVGTTTSANLADGVWHHIVYDGSAKRVYVDGVSVSGTLPATSTQDARVLYIGGYRGGRLWSGQIAHMSLHLT
ncbi:LamG domain-containing protein, partial [Agrobacterium deltaense]